jgi:hypothetical protein
MPEEVVYPELEEEIISDDPPLEYNLTFVPFVPSQGGVKSVLLRP